MKFFKYHGAGNDFLLYDARKGAGSIFTPEQVAFLCDRHLGIGSDGLMVLSEVPGYDFRMDFFNPDGSGGMMCGNGGRCIVAFARDLGLAPAADGSYRFLAPDGPHTAFLLSDDGPVKTVRLGMKPVTEFYFVRLDLHSSPTAPPLEYDLPSAPDLSTAPDSPSTSTPSFRNCSGISSGWFVDTGTRHFVTFVPSVADVDVEVVGKQIRHLPQFGPIGVNVNFVEIISPEEIAVRTFEKGVEGETLACGTGITASAIAAWLEKIPEQVRNDGEEQVRNNGTEQVRNVDGMEHIANNRTERERYDGGTFVPESVLVHARRHDLTVAFTPERTLQPSHNAANSGHLVDSLDAVPSSDSAPLAKSAIHFRDVTLTGPAERVAEIIL